MRSLRLTIFLWIILILTIISALPTVLVVAAGVLSGQLDLTDFGTSFLIFLTLAPALFSIYLIIKMFQMESWARNWYFILTGWSWLMGLIAGNFFIVFISIGIHALVFWKTWNEFF